MRYRTFTYEAIPMSIAHDVIFLVTNSGVKHALAGSEYAKRRNDVERAVKMSVEETRVVKTSGVKLTNVPMLS